MPPRSKPRYHNVRTGCVTCKSRKVKCSEERPHCSRCVRAGLECAGYKLPPKAWIFYGSAEAQKHEHVSQTPSEFSNHSSPADSCDLARRPINSQRAAIQPYTLMQSPLQHGNSDPFSSYAVPIGPRETQILQIMHKFVKPPRPSSFVDAVIRNIKAHYIDDLSDQATAYATLARDIVLQKLLGMAYDVTASTLSLGYIVKSQVALRQKLQALVDGSKSSHAISTAMRTATYLAAVDIVTGNSSAQTHIRALRKLIALHDELVGDHQGKSAAFTLLYIDNMKALVTLTLPVLNPEHWSTYLCIDLYDAEHVSQAGTDDTNLINNTVHRAVRDKILRSFIINQRDSLAVFNRLAAELGDKNSELLPTVLRGRELLRNARLFHVLVDALERLREPVLTPEQVQDQSARAYLSLSIFLWSQLASPTTLTLYTPFDLAFSALRHLRSAITNSRLDEILSPRHEKSYTEARLWALYVGVCTELNRQDVLDSGLVCGDWFLETFRDEANSLHVHSWQHAVTIFELFLYNEKVEPHISQWWDRVSPDDILYTK